jgi:hypothetical protein
VSPAGRVPLVPGRLLGEVVRPAHGGVAAAWRGQPDAGGVALTTLVAGLLAAALGVLVAGGVASLGEAAARARTAADAAALAGAATSPLAGGDGGDPCRAAGRLAAANGATLRACRAYPAAEPPARASSARPAAPEVVVTVTVAVAPRARLPGLPEAVEAAAAAGVRPPDGWP